MNQFTKQQQSVYTYYVTNYVMLRVNTRYIQQLMQEISGMSEASYRQSHFALPKSEMLMVLQAVLNKIEAENVAIL